MPATGSRREFVRAVWDGDSATPVNVQDSGALAALSASNALIDRPAHAPRHPRRRPGQDIPASKWRYCLTLACSLPNCSGNVRSTWNMAANGTRKGGEDVDAQAARIAPVHSGPA
ncbi:hypothetical protein ACFSTD_14070 [Novosphingobium colocasiae]